MRRCKTSISRVPFEELQKTWSWPSTPYFSWSRVLEVRLVWLDKFGAEYEKLEWTLSQSIGNVDLEEHATLFLHMHCLSRRIYVTKTVRYLTTFHESALVWQNHRVEPRSDPVDKDHWNQFPESMDETNGMVITNPLWFWWFSRSI